MTCSPGESGRDPELPCMDLIPGSRFLRIRVMDPCSV